MNIYYLLLFCFFFKVTLAQKKVVCYYASWGIYYSNGASTEPEDIDYNVCTHINYAFIGYESDGTLRVEDEYTDIELEGFKRVTNLKDNNPNLKVLLSVGGASADAGVFSEIAADPDKRSTMVNSAIEYMQEYNFDGIDLDWEIPNEEDRENFVALIQDFRNEFDQNGWLVTAAVASDASEGYDVPQISELLDFINIMTYDMYGPWSDYTGQNSPLYASSVESDWEREHLNMYSAINNWINAGASPDKICAGVAFYGHTFTLEDLSDNGLHAPFSSAGNPGPITETEGELAYFEICQDSSWDCIWDDEQKNPYCTNGDQWLAYDNEESIKLKIDYINSAGLAGVMIWSVDLDDNHGLCGTEKPLLTTIAENL